MLLKRSMLIERSISSKGASVRLQCLTKRACLSRGAFNREEQLFACNACRQAHAYREKHLSVYFALVCFARSIENIWRGPGSDDADHVEPCFCWMMQASRVAKQVACPRRCQLRIARVEASSSFLCFCGRAWKSRTMSELLVSNSASLDV